MNFSQINDRQELELGWRFQWEWTLRPSRGVMMMVEEDSPATIRETFQFLESRTRSEFEFWGVD